MLKYNFLKCYGYIVDEDKLSFKVDNLMSERNFYNKYKQSNDINSFELKKYDDYLNYIYINFIDRNNKDFEWFNPKLEDYSKTFYCDDFKYHPVNKDNIKVFGIYDSDEFSICYVWRTKKEKKKICIISRSKLVYLNKFFELETRLKEKDENFIKDIKEML